MTRILLIDDDSDFAEITSELLIHEGYETIIALNAVEAMEKLDDTIDIVLSDIKLGPKSGSKLVGEIRDRFDIPVIMITAYASTDTAIESLQNRAFDYLLKPCDPRILLDSVERAQEEVSKKKAAQARRQQLIGELTNLKRTG